MRKKIIDVRGLACPEPLIAFTDAARNSDVDVIEISFDCMAARDNITRAAASSGWTVDSVTENPESTVMILAKKA
jgi:TusA-related sulfurtransferase